MPQVDFYILQGTDPAERLRLACRLVEKAYHAGQSTLVRLDDDASLESFDTLLWTFSERAFVPHDRLTATATPPGAPVMLAAGAIEATPAGFDVLVDLALAHDPVAAIPDRLIEIIDGDDARRRRGRERFRAYRERGWSPSTHTIDPDV